MATIRQIVPCLWFNDQAEEAAQFYTSIFEGSRITRVTRYNKEGQSVHGHKPGSVMTVAFQLSGHEFTALNGGPQFKFSEAISLQVMCDSQTEVDHFWSRLSEGGDPSAQQCGWLKDQFGVSWQIVPKLLTELLGEGDGVKAERLTEAMLKMKKLDIARLKQAYDGGAASSSAHA